MRKRCPRDADTSRLWPRVRPPPHQSGAQAGWGSSRSFLLGSSPGWLAKPGPPPPRRPHLSVPPRRAWIFCPRGQPVGTLLRNIHGACAPVSHIALRGHNCPVVTGRDYLDLKPGEVLDLPVVTQPRRSEQDSVPGRPSPEPPLLLSRDRATTLCPRRPDPSWIARLFRGCSELSVTVVAGLEAPPRLLAHLPRDLAVPRAAYTSLPWASSACPWRVAPAPSVKIGPFFKARLKCPIRCPPSRRLALPPPVWWGWKAPSPGHTREWIWCQKAQVCSGRLHFAGWPRAGHVTSLCLFEKMLILYGIYERYQACGP